jgi:hypothetical protein
MFWEVSELIELIKIRLKAERGTRIESFRTLESGAVEEYVVVEITGGKKQLLFRVWPVFCTDRPRIEYRVHLNDEDLESLVVGLLTPGARTRDALLVEKA